MTVAAIRAAALSAAMLAAAWLGWERLGWAAAAVGLGWLDPLGRIAVGFAALSAIDRLLVLLLPPPDPH